MEKTVSEIRDENNKFRGSIKQSAKGFAYFDVTAKGETAEEFDKNMDHVLAKAKAECNNINCGEADGIKEDKF